MGMKIGLLFIALLPTIAACGETPRSVTIIEDGCLTASGSQFVLTDFERAEPHASLKHQRIIGTRPRSTTEAYFLVDADDKLTNLVGKRVRVVGETDPAAQVAEFHQMSPKIRVRPVGSNDLTPAVSDYGVLRFEVHRLRVTSVNPTGDDCSAEFRHRA